MNESFSIQLDLLVCCEDSVIVNIDLRGNLGPCV
jgi:hypothetical protein